jgi:hypothetical protein
VERERERERDLILLNNGSHQLIHVVSLHRLNGSIMLVDLDPANHQDPTTLFGGRLEPASRLDQWHRGDR